MPRSEIRLVFFRGVDFDREIGATDWRIALYMPEFGFRTTVLGRGHATRSYENDVTLVAPAISRMPIIGALQLNLAYFLEALKTRPDVIICNPGVFGGGALYKLIRPKTKVILDVRSIPVEVSSWNSHLNSLYFHMALQSSLWDAISVITPAMLEDLDRRHSLKSKRAAVTWESGYDENVFHPYTEKSPLPIPDETFVVMFHGSWSPNRGLDQSIRSLCRLSDMGVEDVAIVFIGQGKAEHDLRQLAADANVGSRVIFVPPVPHAKIPAYLSNADLGMDPLPNHTWWKNQSPLKVYEYLAMGKPILATDLPCHRGISEAVLLIPDNTPEAFAEGVLKYKHLPPAEKGRLRSVALQDSKRFTWKARAKVLADFIHDHVLA